MVILYEVFPFVVIVMILTFIIIVYIREVRVYLTYHDTKLPDCDIPSINIHFYLLLHTIQGMFASLVFFLDLQKKWQKIKTEYAQAIY